MSNNGKALIVVENAGVPFNIRVWQEATTLRDAGWSVTVTCPATIRVHPDQQASGKTVKPENLDGVTVYRFPLTFAEEGVADYLVGYLSAFIAIARLSWRVWRRGRFNIIHSCSPPDIFCPIAIFYRLLAAGRVGAHAHA